MAQVVYRELVLGSFTLSSVIQCALNFEVRSLGRFQWFFVVLSGLFFYIQ